MSNLVDRIYSIGIVPVIALERVEDAAPLARALCKGGLPIAEVTYRTAAAHDAMIEMKKACPEMLVGAGTVLTTEQVDSALDAGAEFIVSPGLNPDIVKYCQSKNVPVMPGTSCASDVEKALSLGLTEVKFFPAEPSGGIKMISALAAPYGAVRFMPTGGVNAKNLMDYLSNPKIIACGGTWMIDKKAIKEGNFDKIEALTKEAVEAMLDIKLKHVAINAGNEGKAAAEMFAKIFNVGTRETSKGYFAGDIIEIIDEAHAVGTHGHIGVGVSSVQRAMAYYKSQGFEFDESTATYDDRGYVKFIYFKEEYFGFKVHLVNN
ncbi:MAG: bifunctional 4-hydroxy-2-oxoglutarate aldolase/2-dehydro-3-deoxy-phosphogluconate aldolase [Erysipelotrichaceae bacterium]|nr:bifunctional 4-hydroxy-2-oxoglutarate aldolase/2-dehydro-3-deoxy-phosphogluconate aldolase [Erysipelotrichaceae bacterium]